MTLSLASYHAPGLLLVCGWRRSVRLGEMLRQIKGRWSWLLFSVPPPPSKNCLPSTPLRPLCLSNSLKSPPWHSRRVSSSTEKILGCGRKSVAHSMPLTTAPALLLSVRSIASCMILVSPSRSTTTMLNCSCRRRVPAEWRSGTGMAVDHLPVQVGRRRPALAPTHVGRCQNARRRRRSGPDDHHGRGMDQCVPGAADGHSRGHLLSDHHRHSGPIRSGVCLCDHGLGVSRVGRIISLSFFFFCSLPNLT